MFDLKAIILATIATTAGIFGAVGSCLSTAVPTVAKVAIVTTATSGCTFNMYGGGEAGLGYRSESKVFAYHKAEEGNKATAKSSSELSEPIVNAIFEKKEPEKPAPNP